jgi:type II secretory pathway pseudopilin PulG
MKRIERNGGPVEKLAPTISVGRAFVLVLFVPCFALGTLAITGWFLAGMIDWDGAEAWLFSALPWCFLVSLPLSVIYILIVYLVIGVPVIRVNDEGNREWCGPTVSEVGIAWMLVVFLLAVAIPNFLEPSTRSPEARAKAEMRNLAVNLETYFLDFNAYPPAVDIEGRILPGDPERSMVSAGYVPWLLTTPIPYTSALPNDPFHKTSDGGHGPYRYATNGTSCWIMTSRGKDLDDDIPIEDYPVPEIGGCKFKQFMSQFGGPAIEFDATNGTTSSGDIIRVGP